MILISSSEGCVGDKREGGGGKGGEELRQGKAWLPVYSSGNQSIVYPA